LLHFTPIKDIHLEFDYTVLTLVVVDLHSYFIDILDKDYQIGYFFEDDSQEKELFGLTAAEFERLRKLPYVKFTPAHRFGIDLFTAVVDETHAEFPRLLLE
jgi:hypothetical protein